MRAEDTEHLESRDRIRAAFRDAMLGLIDWQAPAELTPREYRRLELLPGPFLDRIARARAERRCLTSKCVPSDTVI